MMISQAMGTASRATQRYWTMDFHQGRWRIGRSGALLRAFLRRMM